MAEHGFFLTCIFSYKDKIENLTLNGKTRVRENPYSAMFTQCYEKRYLLCKLSSSEYPHFESYWDDASMPMMPKFYFHRKRLKQSSRFLVVMIIKTSKWAIPHWRTTFYVRTFISRPKEQSTSLLKIKFARTLVCSRKMNCTYNIGW